MRPSVAAFGQEEYADAGVQGYVTARIADHWFAVPVERVSDLIDTTVIHPVPLAPAEIAGSINIRGSVVTVIDVRVRLGAGREPRSGSCLIVQRANDPHGESCALLIDEAGEVVRLSRAIYEPCPSTLDPEWRACAPGVFRTPDALILLLDVDAALRWDAVRLREQA